MRKLAKKALALFCVLAILFSLTVAVNAGEADTIAAEPHNHEWDNWFQYDNEYHKKTCGCGEVELEEHDWDEGKVSRPATATEDGMKVYTCTECKTLRYETIPAGSTGGTTTGGTTTGGTGETTGSTGGTSTGGTTTGGTTTGGGETGDCEHEWDEGVITTAPTHTEDGVKTYTCICGETYTEVVPSEGHTYGDWVAEDAENHKKECSCGDSIKEAHEYIGTVIKEPTLNEAGVMLYTCELCNRIKTETIPATGDDTGDSTTGGSTTGGSTTGGSTTGGSTTGGSTTGGSTTGGSTTGGSTTGGSTTGGSTTGGSTTGGSTTGGSTTGGTTTGGGETGDCEHLWNEDVTSSATHTEDGVMTYTCVWCGNSYTEVIPAKGHTYGDWVAEDAVNHKKVCSCGDEIIEEHSYVGTVVTEPTHDKAGVMLYTCKLCGRKKLEAIPTTGDDTGDSTTGGSTTGGSTTGGSTTGGSTTGGSTTGGSTTGGSTTGGSTTGGSTTGGSTTGGSTTGGSTTGGSTTGGSTTGGSTTGGSTTGGSTTGGSTTGGSTTGGSTTGGSTTGGSTTGGSTTGGSTTGGSTTGGSTTGGSTTGGSTTGGSTTGGSTTGGSTTGGSTTDDPCETGHAWDDGVITTPATHTAEGVKTYTCLECRETKTEAIDKTPDHEWDNGVVTSQPNHLSAGERTYTCICGETKTESIPKNPGHIWDDGVVTTPATHIADGVKTYTCICGEQKTETIAKTADHEYGAWEKEDDENHKKTCSCSDVAREAHTWDEGVVTLEPTYSAEGVKTFTCSVCNGTKTEAIAKLVSSGGGGGSSRPPKTDDKKDEEPKDENPINISDFNDVSENDWFYSAIEFAIENGLMVGTSGDKFDPYMNTTRGMIVTVLYRLEGSPAVSGTTTFADVAEGAYYADAVIWGQQNGIVSGFSETQFGPNVNVTREQLVTIMYRFAEFKGYDVSQGQNVSLDAYEDAHNVSDWAAEAMKYGVGSGLIYGRSATTLNPKDNAMRAEFAAIMQRFIGANN